MEKFIREMKSAARSLARTKDYSLTVIITLSAGIAVNVAIFAIVNSALLGRAFTEAEGEIGSEQKVILSYGLWQELYASDRNVLGREMRLSGRPFTIVGVMPRNFVFINPEVRLWIPAAFTAEEKTVHHN